MQSNGGRRTSSQQHQFQEASQPHTGEPINCVSKVLEPRPDPTNSLTPASGAPL